MRPDRSITSAFVLLLTATLLLADAPVARADSAAKIRTDAGVALEALYARVPGTRALGAKAKGILVFPKIVKAGFIFGGQGGDGALRKGGKTVAYYRNLAASYGFQAGIQSFGYALFFMDDDALGYLNRSGGWELGTGPSLVIVDEGFAKSLTTTTLQKGVYAFIFDQKGLMGGIGVQGSKITRIHPK
ncbi:MAG TPA: YSC84-related protein [Candidatus Binatia bacterium]|jgi:lipid-binding SYLF domain-containing protein|nr:YSC84-related protein [Candidatus Binatia bacterium]